jgi:hypothetical protein
MNRRSLREFLEAEGVRDDAYSWAAWSAVPPARVRPLHCPIWVPAAPWRPTGRATHAYADGNPLTNTDPSGQGCLSGLGWI